MGIYINNPQFPFLLQVSTYATAACVADATTFPLDVAKVRLQVQGQASKNSGDKIVYRGLPSTLVTIVRQEGVWALFNGLSAGLQRQVCFSSIRFGMYESVKNFYGRLLFGGSPTTSRSLWETVAPTKFSVLPIKKGNHNENSLDIPIRIAAGLTTGSLCVIIAQPTDVVKIRFQASSRADGQLKYKNTRDAYKTIYRQDGIGGLWKGWPANATRNAIVNVAEIVVYDTVKETFIRKNLMKDDVVCHFTVGAIAGFCGTFVASPVDVIKTRYINSPTGTYRGAIDCAMQTFKKEGLAAFYKGFIPSFCRITTWNIILWLSFEQMKAFVIKKKRESN